MSDDYANSVIKVAVASTGNVFIQTVTQTKLVDE